jgi:hypothetical protein
MALIQNQYILEVAPRHWEWVNMYFYHVNVFTSNLCKSYIGQTTL